MITLSPTYKNFMGASGAGFLEAADPEAEMIQWLKAAVNAKPAGWVKSVPMLKIDADLKWRYMSALQKAIRRGEEQLALSAAIALYQIDPPTLWRRLAVIAVEDIGIGDPLAVGMTLAASRLKKTRDTFGAVPLIGVLVQMLCHAPKDRLSCIFGGYVRAGRGKGGASDRAWVKKEGAQGAERLAEIYGDPLLSLTARGHAAKMLVAWKHGEGKHMLWAVNDKTVPPLIAYIAKVYCTMAQQGDDMWMAYPLIFQSAQQAGTHLEIRTMEPQPVDLLHGVLTATFDQYVKDGKKVVAYFMKACEPLAEWLDKHPLEDRFHVVERVIFNVEGGILDRSMLWPDAMSIYSEFLTGTFGEMGLSPEELKELATIVIEGQGTLDKARRRVIKA